MGVQTGIIFCQLSFFFLKQLLLFSIKLWKNTSILKKSCSCKSRKIPALKTVYCLLLVYRPFLISLTCTGWSLWQPRRHRISLKSRLLWRQEVGIRERRWCYIGGSYQCAARVAELQCALIGRLDGDRHGERLRRSCWLLRN